MAQWSATATAGDDLLDGDEVGEPRSEDDDEGASSFAAPLSNAAMSSSSLIDRGLKPAWACTCGATAAAEDRAVHEHKAMMTMEITDAHIFPGKGMGNDRHDGTSRRDCKLQSRVLPFHRLLHSSAAQTGAAQHAKRNESSSRQ